MRAIGLAAFLIMAFVVISVARADGPGPGGGSGSSISTPVSVANGGTGDATTGYSSASRPASPDSRNDEFDGTAYTGWTTTLPWTTCAQSGTAIDPYAQFNTAHIYRHSWNSFWPGWLAIQPTTAGENCGIVKAITVNTNDLVWARFRATEPNSGTSTLTSMAELCLASDTSLTHYICVTCFNNSGTPTCQVNNDGATTALTQAFAIATAPEIEILGLHKVGTTYYPWYGSFGAMRVQAGVVNANAMADVALITGTNGTNAPGNAIIGYDFIRFSNSATALPW